MKKKSAAIILVFTILLVSSFSVATFAQPVSVPVPQPAPKPMPSPIHVTTYGEIGIYKNMVYIEMYTALPAVRLGNQTYFAKRTITVPPVPVKGIKPLFITAAWFVVGDVNSSCAVHYVISHVGQKITIFPPASFALNPITPFIVLPPEFSVTVLDVGNFTFKPAGVFTVLYVPAPHQVSQPSPKPYPRPQPHPIPMFNTSTPKPIPMLAVLSAQVHVLRFKFNH